MTNLRLRVINALINWLWRRKGYAQFFLAELTAVRQQRDHKLARADPSG